MSSSRRSWRDRLDMVATAFESALFLLAAVFAAVTALVFVIGLITGG